MYRVKLFYGIVARIILFFIISAFLFFSCEKEPTSLGRGLLPPSDDIILSFTSATEIMAYSDSSDPVITSYNPLYLLGSYSDSVIGKTSAEFLTSFRLSTSDTVGPERTVDSMIFYVDLNDYFGDSLSFQEMKVHELTRKLDDSIYYSDFNPEGWYDPDPLATHSFLPGDTILQVHINNASLKQRFESAIDTIFHDPEDFADFFYGFYVNSEPVSGGEAINYIGLRDLNTRFIVYYQDDTTGSKALNLIISESTPKVNIFDHRYENTLVSQNLGDTSSSDTVLFISGMAGVSTHIRFPQIESWRDSIPVAIHKAELIIPVADTSEQLLSSEVYPDRTMLYLFTEGGDLDYLKDYQIDDSNNKTIFGGPYRPSDQSYRFNIGFHLQSYIDGEVDNFDLFLIPGRGTSTGHRVMLKSPAAADRKMILKITYSEL